MCLKRLSDSAGSGEWAAEAEAAHRGHGAESTTGATETWDAESQGEWADPTAWAEPEMLEEGSPETQIPAEWADRQEGAATAAEWSETQVRALSCRFNHSTCHCDIVYSWQSCSQRPQESMQQNPQPPFWASAVNTCTQSATHLSLLKVIRWCIYWRSSKVV